MKPLGMDRNRVLVYEGDIVRYGVREYKAYVSELTGNLLLLPYIEGLSERAAGLIEFAVPGSVEVVNVSDRTNYERYFADLCSREQIWSYICRGVDCKYCIVNESLCTDYLVFNQWIDQQAVKL